MIGNRCRETETHCRVLSRKLIPFLIEYRANLVVYISLDRLELVSNIIESLIGDFAGVLSRAIKSGDVLYNFFPRLCLWQRSNAFVSHRNCQLLGCFGFATNSLHGGIECAALLG